ncbi:mitochondrial substrate carrier family protein [Tieghemostelium lacteum]|uniref:Mitochondrial substrate carrier family protein n=1 Tax=Tieghemostelium lacteum TaxID=361077 RepID=A0A152AAL6_TIELA|nr:mitochondrial substrate carrier family protein [Tieghemostelium lacteum]|eukprot:KYR03171.1 mitochondrial substrate carrier family protein [Tieghemostelium lacteum]
MSIYTYLLQLQNLHQPNNTNNQIYKPIKLVQHQPREERSKNAILHFIAGGLGGAVGVIVTSPLEVIKTQLQGKNSDLLYIGKPRFVPASAYSLYHLAKREGIKALWKGLGPHLFGVVPARAIHFSTYSFTKSIMEKLGYQEGPILWATSASSAGVAVAILTSPIWLIKTRLQLQTNLKNFNEGTRYRGYLHCCLNIIREEGPTGFFKGLSASIIGVSESAFQFVLYEKMKRSILEKKRECNYPDYESLTTTEYLVSAGSSKLVAAVTTYPHEVIRTRMREQLAPGAPIKYTNVLPGMALIVKEEGIRGLFKGVGPHVARVVPNSCIMFLTYEFVLDVAHSTNKLFHKFI